MTISPAQRLHNGVYCITRKEFNTLPEGTVVMGCFTHTRYVIGEDPFNKGDTECGRMCYGFESMLELYAALAAAQHQGTTE